MSESWGRLGKVIFMSLFIVSFVIVTGGCAAEQESSADRSGEGEVTAGEDDNEDGSESAEGSKSSETFTNDNYGRLVTDPDSYVGARVDIVGSLLRSPEFLEGQMVFQMFADPENSEWNTVVLAEDNEMTLGAQDYVRVMGAVVGTFEGENAFGASIVAPQIEADEVEVISAVEALDPAHTTLELSDTQEDQGFSVTLDKLEFGEETTRVYLTAQNDTGYPASFYSFNAKIIQGTRQLDQENPYEYNLTEPQSDLNPGVQTGGVIAFGPVDPSQPFQIQFEWYSENFDITANPIVFEINGNEVTSSGDGLQEGDASAYVETAEEDISSTETSEVQEAVRSDYVTIVRGDFTVTYSYYGSTYRDENDINGWVGEEKSQDIFGFTVNSVDVEETSESEATLTLVVSFEDNSGYPCFVIV